MLKKFLLNNNINITVKQYSKKSKQFFSLTKDYPIRKDHYLNGFSNQHDFRVSFIDCSRSTLQSVENFKLDDKEQIKTLGNMFSTSMLIASFLKNEERIKCVAQFDSQQSLQRQQFYAESIANGEIRGFAKKDSLENDNDEQQLITFIKPSLIIQRFLENAKQANYSQVEIDYQKNSFENIQIDGESIEKFYNESEQLPTFCNLRSGFLTDDIKDLRVIGILLQILPGANTQNVEKIFNHIVNSQVWQEYTFEQKLSYERIRDLFKYDLKIDDMVFNRSPVDFFCRCKKENFMQMMLQLGHETIADMKSKNENKMICSHCNKEHILETQDFDIMLSNFEQKIEVLDK